jgi:hypothetical protein
VLNKTLFQRLENFAGKGQVRIAHENRPMSRSYVRAINEDGSIGYRMRRVGTCEEYMIDCPACSDTRKRLAFSYLWGVYDEQTGSRNLWLMHCYNEECQEDREWVVSLYRQIMQGARAQVQTDATAESAPKPTGEVQSPGAIYRLDRLQQTHPSHRAVRYAESRMYDVDELGRVFGVGYCPDSPFSQVADRLVVPFYHAQKLVGWSARYLGDPPAGDDRIRKWFNMPGMTTDFFYRGDEAAERPVKVLVEGPGDVWNTGDGAMGCLRKTLGDRIPWLVDRWRPDDIVVVMLDPLQHPRERERGRPHHIEEAVYALKTANPRGKVVKVYLPSHLDPGDSDKMLKVAMIREACREAGYVVPEGWPND